MTGLWHCSSLARSSAPSQNRLTVSCREPPMDVAELQLIPTRLSQHGEALTDRHPTTARHASDKKIGKFRKLKISGRDTHEIVERAGLPGPSILGPSIARVQRSGGIRPHLDCQKHESYMMVSPSLL